jgi:hypothetical protein
MLVIPAAHLLRSYCPSSTTVPLRVTELCNRPAELRCKNLPFCTAPKHNVLKTDRMCTVMQGRRKSALRRSMYLYL